MAKWDSTRKTTKTFSDGLLLVTVFVSESAGFFHGH